MSELRILYFEDDETDAEKGKDYLRACWAILKAYPLFDGQLSDIFRSIEIDHHRSSSNAMKQLETCDGDYHLLVVDLLERSLNTKGRPQQENKGLLLVTLARSLNLRIGIVAISRIEEEESFKAARWYFKLSAELPRGGPNGTGGAAFVS